MRGRGGDGGLSARRGRWRREPPPRASSSRSSGGGDVPSPRDESAAGTHRAGAGDARRDARRARRRDRATRARGRAAPVRRRSRATARASPPAGLPVAVLPTRRGPGCLRQRRSDSAPRWWHASPRSSTRPAASWRSIPSGSWTWWGRSAASTPSPLEVARRLGGVNALSSRSDPRRAARVLETTWISGQTGETLATVRAPVIPTTFPALCLGGNARARAQVPPGRPVSRALALGDLDGDGRTELIVADEQNITLYRTTEGGAPTPVEGDLQHRQRPDPPVDAGAAHRIRAGRSSSSVDQRGQGRQGIRARCWVEPSGGYRGVYDATGWYLRVARVGAENWLLEQEAGEDEPVPAGDPAPRVGRGELRIRRASRVPRGISLYGLGTDAAHRQPGAGDRRLRGRLPSERVDGARPAALDERGAAGRLGRDVRVQSLAAGAAPGRRRTRSWRASQVEVVPLSIPSPEPGDPRLREHPPRLPAGAWRPPRLAATLFNRGRIHRLRWKDGAFVRVWQSGVTEGTSPTSPTGISTGTVWRRWWWGSSPRIRRRDPQPARTPQGSHPRLRASLGWLFPGSSGTCRGKPYGN